RNAILLIIFLVATSSASAQVIANGTFAVPDTLTSSEAPNGCTDDTWTPTNIANAPSPRFDHRAVWTGGEMIVWGGDDTNTLTLNTGGRYNPGTDRWTATS